MLGGITAVTTADLSAISAIDCGLPSGWSKDQLAGELKQASGWQFTARLTNGDVAGYIFGRRVADESEILRLAVAGQHRRQGIATSLLEHVFVYLAKHCVRHCYLEFRAGNNTARSLYKKYNFSPTGQRKNYYNEPVEDAVCMTKIIKLKG